MALFRTVARIAKMPEQYSRLAYCMSKRNYADVATQLSFTFATPSECFYNNEAVKQVDVPSLSGDFGILAQHVPTIAVLKPGVVVVHNDDGSNKFFVSSGSVTVNEDSSVQILAEEATPLDRLDMSAIKEGLAKAQQDVSSASSEKAKAEAQIAVDCFEALQKAME